MDKLNIKVKMNYNNISMLFKKIYVKQFFRKWWNTNETNENKVKTF